MKHNITSTEAQQLAEKVNCNRIQRVANQVYGTSYGMGQTYIQVGNNSGQALDNSKPGYIFCGSEYVGKIVKGHGLFFVSFDRGNSEKYSASILDFLKETKMNKCQALVDGKKHDVQAAYERDGQPVCKTHQKAKNVEFESVQLTLQEKGKEDRIIEVNEDFFAAAVNKAITPEQVKKLRENVAKNRGAIQGIVEAIHHKEEKVFTNLTAHLCGVVYNGEKAIYFRNATWVNVSGTADELLTYARNLIEKDDYTVWIGTNPKREYTRNKQAVVIEGFNGGKVVTITKTTKVWGPVDLRASKKYNKKEGKA